MKTLSSATNTVIPMTRFNTRSASRASGRACVLGVVPATPGYSARNSAPGGRRNARAPVIVPATQQTTTSSKTDPPHRGRKHGLGDGPHIVDQLSFDGTTHDEADHPAHCSAGNADDDHLPEVCAQHLTPGEAEGAMKGDVTPPHPHGQHHRVHQRDDAEQGEELPTRHR